MLMNDIVLTLLGNEWRHIYIPFGGGGGGGTERSWSWCTVSVGAVTEAKR